MSEIAPSAPTAPPSTTLTIPPLAAGPAAAGKPSPMDMLGAMLQGEVTQGLAEAKEFEQFVRRALSDIMKKELSNEKLLGRIAAKVGA